MIWYVNPSTGDNAYDGRTAETGFRDLARAIEAAKPGDTIHIAPGLFDRDLPGLVSAARASDIAVLVAGSE